MGRGLTSRIDEGEVIEGENNEETRQIMSSLLKDQYQQKCCNDPQVPDLLLPNNPWDKVSQEASAKSLKKRNEVLDNLWKENYYPMYIDACKRLNLPVL